MAFTMGFVTVGPMEILGDVRWLAHEYGHYIISLITGIFYLAHGIQSLAIPNNAPNYYDHPSEREADYWGGVRRDNYGIRYVP
jgi:hypothetical protein